MIIFDWLFILSAFTQCRYRLSGMIIPGLKDWFEGTFGASLQHKTPATVSAIHVYSLCLSVNGKEESDLPKSQWFVLFQPILTSSAVPPPNLNEAFVEELKSTGIPLSHDAEDRVFRGHGKT